MNKWIRQQAESLGFERVAVLQADAVPKFLARWKRDAEARGNLGSMVDDPRVEMTECRFVIILSMPFPVYMNYPETCARVSGYYFVSQKAYLAASSLADLLRKADVAAERAITLPVKPLARACGFGEYGKNGIIVRHGPHQAFQMILTNAALAEEILITPTECTGHTGCEKLCPGGALREGEVDNTRCLRNHMMSGRIVPESFRAAMGTRLLGCDDCQKACPGSATEPVPEWYEDYFKLDHLLLPEKLRENHGVIRELIGANYAREERILAQAAIAAGNAANNERYAHVLLNLSVHKNETVAEHARWALDKIRES